MLMYWKLIALAVLLGIGIIIHMVGIFSPWWTYRKKLVRVAGDDDEYDHWGVTTFGALPVSGQFAAILLDVSLIAYLAVLGVLGFIWWQVSNNGYTQFIRKMFFGFLGCSGTIIGTTILATISFAIAKDSNMSMGSSMWFCLVGGVFFNGAACGLAAYVTFCETFT